MGKESFCSLGFGSDLGGPGGRAQSHLATELLPSPLSFFSMR